MRFQRIHEAVNSRPWFISAQGFASVRALINRALEAPRSSFVDDIAEDVGDLVRQRPEFSLDPFTGIARIHVFGCLGQHLSRLEKTCGNTDYAQIISEIEQAKGAQAKAIVFIFDSPGGMCLGCDEAARAIANAGVPTLAWTDSMACSAAYYLASGCSQIVATRTAIMGNIGVICPWIDSAQMWEIEGLDFQPITSEGADLKSTFHGPSITDDQRAFVQEDVNQMGTMFRDHVLTHRAHIDSEVWRAGWYCGERALELGLIDAIGDETKAIMPFLPASTIAVS